MRRLPPFPALRAFEAAARLGSLAAAGDELHQTPSAISHQVRALEAWFGQALFVRGPRRVSLTPKGARLLADLSSALDLLEDACTALRPSAASASLSVHCAPSFASHWLTPRLADFMRRHPSLTVQLTSSAEPLDLQRQAEVDLDISYGLPPPKPGVVVEPLGSEPIVPLAAPRLFKGLRPTLALELAHFPLIDSQLNPVQWADWFKLNGLRLPSKARPSFDRGSLAVAAAADGLGIALETSRFAEAEIARGALWVLEGPGFQNVVRETHFLCYRKANAERPALVTFRRWLLAELGVLPENYTGAPVSKASL